MQHTLLSFAIRIRCMAARCTTRWCSRHEGAERFWFSGACAFNFRGTGLSQGEHGHGNGELDDVRAALDWIDHEFHLPLMFAGFSFGAAVGLRAACPDARVKAAIGLGLPVSPIDDRTYDFSFLANCSKPKLFVSGDRDQFGTRAQLEALVRSVSDPKKLILIAGGDHFFEGRLRELREAIEQWVGEAVIP